MKKDSIIKDVLILVAFAGLAYMVSHNYKQKKLKEKQSREFLHFQLF